MTTAAAAQMGDNIDQSEAQTVVLKVALTMVIRDTRDVSDRQESRRCFERKNM